MRHIIRAYAGCGIGFGFLIALINNTNNLRFPPEDYSKKQLFMISVGKGICYGALWLPACFKMTRDFNFERCAKHFVFVDCEHKDHNQQLARDGRLIFVKDKQISKNLPS